MAVDDLRQEARLRSLVGEILELAEASGATQAAAAASIDNGLSATARLGEVETLEHQRDHGLGVTVFFGTRKGSASSTEFSLETARETVEKACTIARFTSEDDCAGLADADRMATDLADLELCYPWDLEPAAAIDIAVACERAALERDPRVTNSEGATLSTNRGLRVYANSHGFVGAQSTTSHSLSCAVVAANGSGMQRDYWYTLARDFEDLESARHVGELAADRTLARLGARQIETCRAPVIFPAELARGLLSHFVAAIRGSNQYRRSSFLLDAVGEEIFPSFVSIAERPHIPKAVASAMFDHEGVATKDRDLVSDGVLQSYVLNSYSARKLGLETTGNAGGINNLIVTANAENCSALLQAVPHGFLVQELMGHGINLVTGDYSRGANGFWIERGRIQFPVEEVTIAGNLRDMYRDIRAVGRDVDMRGAIRTGSMLIGEMTIAGR